MPKRLRLLGSVVAVLIASTAVYAQQEDWTSVKQRNPDLYVCASIVPAHHVPEKFPDTAVISSCSKLIAIVEQKHRDNDPRSVDFYYGRALAEANVRDWQSAMMDLDKVLQQYPQDSDFLALKNRITNHAAAPTEPNARAADRSAPPASISGINKLLSQYDQRDPGDPELAGNTMGVLLVRAEIYNQDGHYRYALEDLSAVQQYMKDTFTQADWASEAGSTLASRVNAALQIARAKAPSDHRSYNVGGSDFVSYICEPLGARISIDKTNLVVIDDEPMMGSHCVSAFREAVDGKLLMNEAQCQVPVAGITQAFMPLHKTVSVSGNVVYWGVQVKGIFALKAAAAPLRESFNMSLGIRTDPNGRHIPCHEVQ